MKYSVVAAFMLVFALSMPDRGRADDVQALTQMVHTLSRHWQPDCTVHWTRNIQISLRIGSDGRIVGDPAWTNPIDDPSTRKAAEAVIKTIVDNQPYLGLPATIYDQTLAIEFEPRQACGQTN